MTSALVAIDVPLGSETRESNEYRREEQSTGNPTVATRDTAKVSNPEYSLFPTHLAKATARRWISTRQTWLPS